MVAFEAAAAEQAEERAARRRSPGDQRHVHVLQSRCRWKDAPAISGPPKALYNRTVRWAAKGVWRSVFEALAAAGGPPTEVLIDSTHGGQVLATDADGVGDGRH